MGLGGKRPSLGLLGMGGAGRWGTWPATKPLGPGIWQPFWRAAAAAAARWNWFCRWKEATSSCPIMEAKESVAARGWLLACSAMGGMMSDGGRLEMGGDGSSMD